MNKLRVLVVGVGSIGERHVRCLLATSRAEVGVCDPDPAKLSQNDIRGAFTDLDDAIGEGWDGAVVATPAPIHVGLARRLVAAGVSPLIEKPLAVTEDGVAELLAEAERSAIPAGVAYVYRAHPAVSAMREHVVAGHLGRPLQAIVQSGQHFPTYRPAYASTYYRDHAAGGGAIQDALTHWFNLVEWFLGPTTRIAVDAEHMALPDVTIEDTVQALARNGSAMVAYTLNQHQPANEHTLTIVCERGLVRFELHHARWRIMSEPDTAWQEHPVPIRHRDDWFTRQELIWLDSVEGRQPPLCSLREAAQTLRTNRAALRSVEQGGAWVNIEHLGG